MAQLSEWLQLMLAEIARKQDEERRAAEEQRVRAQPKTPENQTSRNPARRAVLHLRPSFEDRACPSRRFRNRY